MDDEAILASLDSEPGEFAVFYRRHVGRLLDYLAGRLYDPQQAADLCAETFAAALRGARRFDPERESAAVWLDRSSRRLLARAEHRGTVDDRARRRLGMAPLRHGEHFVRDLEEELVEAARFRAARPRRRRIRLPPRAFAASIAAVALAVLAALVLSSGGDDPAGDDRQATTPASGATVRLPPMLEALACARGRPPEESALAAIPDVGLFRRPQRSRDATATPVSESLTWMPLTTFDPAEIRLAGDGRLQTRLHVLASRGVAADGRCGSDDGVGVCLIAHGRFFRCFVMSDVRAGRALARTPDGLVVGIVPDGIDRVSLTTAAVRAGVGVVENVYEADLGAPAGTPVRVEFPQLAGAGCARKLDPDLLARVAALRYAPRGADVLPPAAESVLADWQLDQVVDDRSRYWGRHGGVDFWVVPAVPLGEAECEPATAACVVAVTRGSGRADAECVLEEEARRDAWRLTPLLRGHAAIYGIVPDGVTGVRVTMRGRTAGVEARDNVVGGVLPFGYFDDGRTRVRYVRGQR